MDFFAAIEAGSSAIGAVTLAWGTFKAIGIFSSRLELARELAREKKNTANLKESVDALKAANEGWGALVLQLTTEVRELRDDVQRQSHKLNIAVQYIVKLHLADRAADRRQQPLPPIPDELREDFAEELRAHAATFEAI